MWRVQKYVYGPLNPPARSDDSSRAKWGRWDLPGALTIYGANESLGAYRETLSWASPELPRLDELFPDDEGNNTAPALDTVAQEWGDRHHMRPRSLPAGWRQDRRLYTLTLPRSGWLIDLSHSESIAALNRTTELMEAVDPYLRDQPNPATGHAEPALTLAELQGHDRRITTTIARWIHDQTLYDGHLPHGIQYASKWGSDLICYAVWLRRLADGADPDTELTRLVGPSEGVVLDPNESCLQQAASQLNIVLH